ncbi:MAG: SufS family cysteine desulfurase [Planctomycetaceae bacterium]
MLRTTFALSLREAATMPATKIIRFDELRDEFEFLGNWQDQCRYLIELGEELPQLTADEQSETFRVLGCQSRVWVIPTLMEEGGRKVLDIRAKSDARIVDGLVVVLLSLTQGRTPQEVLDIDFNARFAELGLESQLVPQRKNGLYAMVSRVQQFARDLSAEAGSAVVKPSIRTLSAEPETRLPLSEDGTTRRRTFDAELVRLEFPALNQALECGFPVTYLDTASSAQKPQRVIDKEREVYEQYYANAYRGVYTYGDRVSAELESSREKVARFLGATSEREIVFTSGSTMGINLVAQAWGRKFLSPGDEIVLNELEHHANFVPWQRVAEQTGAVVRLLPLTDDGQIDLSRAEDVFNPRTRLLAITGMSNVLGTVPPIRELTRRAHDYGAKVLIDGAQSVPHMPIHVVQEEVDFLVFSGHKAYGPSGVGVLYGRYDLLAEMDPFLCGGHMIAEVTSTGSTWAEPPAKFEAGTPAIAQAIALGEAIDYLNEFTLCPVHKHEQALLRHAHASLEAIPGLTIYGPAPSEKGAIVSFTIEGASAYDLAQQLNFRGVFVRHGHHCTMPLHARLNVPATVRASFGLYSTLEDVDRLTQAIEFAMRELKIAR